jgi:hypothetical protein
MPDGFKIADGYVDITVNESDLDAAVAGVEAKLAAIKDRAIDIGINQATVDKGIAVIQAKLNALKARIDVGLNPTELAAAVAGIKAMLDNVQSRWNVRVDGIPEALAGLAAMNAQMSDLQRHTGAAKDAMAALAAISFTGLGGGGGVFGRWGQWFHWIIAGGAELAAVVIPATVALGSAALVAAQGFQLVSQHMTAVWTAAEATSNIFHQTAGTMLGFADSLQKAQNAANPMVFQALGGALQLVHQQFGGLSQTGLEVMRVFDNFVAHVQADFQGGFGDTVHNLLSKMVVDLVTLAQIFGTVGHAILNFANAMPGLANVLLNFLNVLSQILLTLSELPTWLITTVFALEELYRWGGLAVTIFARMGAAIANLVPGAIGLIGGFGARFASVFTTIGETVGGFIINLGLMMERMGSAESEAGKLAKATAGAGSKIADMGVGIGEAIAAVPTWAAAVGVILVGGFIALAIWADHAKTAIQQWAKAMNDALAKTSDLKVVNQTASDLQQTTVKLDSAQAQLNKTFSNTYTAAQQTMSHYSTLNPVIQQQEVAVAQLKQQHDVLNTTLQKEYGSLGFLESRYGTTYIGALALAQQAGVSITVGLTQTTQAAEIARLKVADLVAGYRAMGTPMGVVGADMNALAVQAGLQSTKVDQLNQAWSQFVNNVTSGMSSLAGFTTALGNLTQLTGQTVDATTGFTTTGTTTATLQQFIKALQQGPMTGPGASAWTNFTSIVNGSMTQMMTFLRTAGAEGAISGAQFTQAVKDMVAQMVPFIGTNQTALSILGTFVQQAGGPAITSLQQLKSWLGNTSNASTDLGNTVQTATQKMSDLNKIAQNLGNVLNTDIVATMDAAQIKASGLSGATEKYAQDLQNVETPAKQLKTDHDNLFNILVQLTGSTKTATQIMQTYAGQLTQTGNSANTANGDANTGVTGLLKKLGQMPPSVSTTVNVNTGQAYANLTALYQLEQRVGAGPMASKPLAEGGRIPGFGGGDIVPAMLEPGETVINKSMSLALAPLFKHMGVKGYADGGMVTNYAGMASSSPQSVVTSGGSGLGGPVINMNWFGPQMPSPEQQRQIGRNIAMQLVAPA